LEHLSLHVLENSWIPSVTWRYGTILGLFAILVATFANLRRGMRTLILLLAAYLHHVKPNIKIPIPSQPSLKQLHNIQHPPNTNLIPASDCSPHLTFGGPEPPKSHNQAIIRLPMAIARQACKTPMRCDAAHPTPHPLRLNAGPHGIEKHILPI
jgi:hypothetical protein